MSFKSVLKEFKDVADATLEGYVNCRLDRYLSDEDTTFGKFFVNDEFVCYIVEDQYNAKKVWGETRIPEGVFEISYRYEGIFHKRYKTKFADIHKGILCVHNAPDWKIIVDDTVFQYILIHLGNSDDDTAGCLLPNTTVNEDTMRGSNSTGAYKKLYSIISEHLDNGKKVSLEVRDLD